MKNKIYYSFLILLLFNSCYKDYDLINQEYYFLRGLFVNGQPPLLLLYKQSTKGGVKLPFSEYQLELVDEKNTTYKMNSNGSFSFLSIKPNTNYTIRWRLKSENNWHEFKKKTVNFETSLNDKSFVKAENELFINKPKNDSFVYFLFNKYNRELLTGNFLESFIIEYPEAFLELNQNNESLILWPPSNKYYLDRFKNSTNFCFKPFDWRMRLEPIYKNFQLYSMSNADFEFYNNLHKNDLGKNTPSSVGEGVLWDYSKNNVKAKIVNFNNYDNINIFDYVKEEEKLYVDLLINNQPVDTTQFKILSISFRFLNSNNYYNVLRFYGDYAYAGCLDFYASHFNGVFGRQCGNVENEYNLIFAVTVQNLITQKRTFNEMPVYKYFKEDRIILNIKP